MNIGNTHKGGISITEKETKEQNEIKKEYLNEYLKLKRKIISLNEQIDQLRCEKMQAKGQVITDMPRAGKISDISDYITQLEKIECEIANTTRMMYLRRLKIEKSIMYLDDGIESDLLRKRYIEGKPWEEICNEINSSWRNTHYIHSRALKNINIA
ncbi:MAG: hypothetical protein ACERKN_07175 [Velocimicrobium sp.]